MAKLRITPCVAVVGLGLSACTNPYDPAQRFVGGGLLGAGAGAAIGAAAGGGPGAALGAAIGGATGAVGGVATTPPSPYGYYDTLATTAIPAIMVIKATANDGSRQLPVLLHLPTAGADQGHCSQS